MAEILDYMSPEAELLKEEYRRLVQKGISSVRRYELEDLLLESGRIYQNKEYEDWKNRAKIGE